MLLSPPDVRLTLQGSRRGLPERRDGLLPGGIPPRSGTLTSISSSPNSPWVGSYGKDCAAVSTELILSYVAIFPSSATTPHSPSLGVLKTSRFIIVLISCVGFLVSIRGSDPYAKRCFCRMASGQLRFLPPFVPPPPRIFRLF